MQIIEKYNQFLDNTNKKHKHIKNINQVRNSLQKLALEFFKSETQGNAVLFVRSWLNADDEDKNFFSSELFEKSLEKYLDSDRNMITILIDTSIIDKKESKKIKDALEKVLTDHKLDVKVK